jgi:hypothetical protein
MHWQILHTKFVCIVLKNLEYCKVEYHILYASTIVKVARLHFAFSFTLKILSTVFHGPYDNTVISKNTPKYKKLDLPSSLL